MKERKKYIWIIAGVVGLILVWIFFLVPPIFSFKLSYTTSGPEYCFDAYDEVKPAEDKCLFYFSGDSLGQVMEDNQRTQARTPEHYLSAGCSLPVRYRYCDINMLPEIIDLIK